MSTLEGARVQALGARFGDALAGRLESQIARFGWDAPRLAEHQRDRLRALLATAIERSAFTRAASPASTRHALSSTSSRSCR